MRSSIIQIVDRDKRLPAFGAIIVVLSADHDATVFTPKCANLAQEKGGIHMPPIPTACQPIADEIANLQARDT
jgi:hypothetical protein